MTSHAQTAADLAHAQPQVAAVHALLAIAEAIDRLPIVVPINHEASGFDARDQVRELVGPDRPVLIVHT